MKPNYLITALFSIVSVTEAVEVGETVNITKFVADGVYITGFVGEYTTVRPAASERFYDSEKGAPWTEGYAYGDSLMCWSHTAANLIQYWQSYYGIFYRGEKPLPYGSDGVITNQYNIETKQSDAVVADPTRLNVAKDIFNAWVPNGPGNVGGKLENATNYYFTYSKSGGGYYDDYFGTYANSQQPVTHTFSNVDSMSSLTDAVLPAFGIDPTTKKKTEMGLIPYIGVSYDVKGSDGQTLTYGHTLTCYGFTTDAGGKITSLLLSNSDDETIRIVEAHVKEVDGKLQMYTNSSYSERWNMNTQNDWYISSVSHIETPQVLRDMLAEYSDTENEALVWNGGQDGQWQAQQATTEALPTTSTGWDVHVNGEKIAKEYQGYYHSYAADGRDVRFDGHSQNKEVTIIGSVTPGDIEIAEGDYTFKAGESALIAGSGQLTIHGGASLTTELQLGERSLVLESGAKLQSECQIVVTGEFRTLNELEDAAGFNLRSAVAPVVTVDANLVLSADVILNMEVGVDLMGHTLRIVDPNVLFTTNAENFVFYNVGSLAFGDSSLLTLRSAGNVATQPLEQEGYRLVFSNGTLSMQAIPEPATATLSLLALAGLVLRRRR